MPEPRRAETAELIETARRLWTGAFQGVLSTHSTAHPGYPFGSVAPYCADREGLPLLLLSHLAQHSRNLAADPRCNLLLSEFGGDDVQQQARLSVIADCELLNSEQEAAERYFRCFPRARPYFEQLNFRFFRLRPRALHLNAGFASARWLGPERVVVPNPFDPETEIRLIAEIGARQAELRRLFSSAADDADIAVAGIDSHGMDLRQGERMCRVSFPQAVSTPLKITELIPTLASV